MRSSTPKMLHPVCGRPLVAWPILAAREAGAGRVAAIVSPGRDISAGFPGEVETVVQPQPDGTGGAVRAALPLIEGAETVLVLSGDHPLISAEVVSGFLAAHASSGAAATMMTIELEDPGSYGRVVRDADGNVERVVEAKGGGGDASAEELAIREINAGTYAFEAGPLAAALRGLSNDNAQGEYYLTDVFAALREAGHAVAGHRADDFAVTMGVNNRAELAAVEAEGRRRILERHMLAGVTIVDPAGAWIDADVQIAADARIEPGSSLRGATAVGAGSVVGPLSTLIDSRLGAEVHVPHSYLVECEVEDGCNVGPFAYLRPGAHLAPGAKAGAFVEVKNSRIGAGAKVPHLAYVGDAEIGEGSNLGAGTVTANYDGFRKHRTTIGAGVRIGVDTMLVAPVEVGDAAYTGAGAVIRSDVPEGALAVSQNDQRNIEGYSERKAEEDEKGMSVIEQRQEAAAVTPTAIPHDYLKRMMVFGGRTSMELAAKVAGKLDLDLGQVTLKTFANGEVYCRYEESIRGADVFLVQSTCASEQTGMTPNDALVELLTMIDAAQGASAHRIIAVMPWYGYARQDKKSSPREPISARIMAKCLEGVGVDRVLTMDLHAGQVQGFFHVPVDHMTAMPMLTQWFADQELSEELVIVSPDAGRVKTARNFARRIGTHWAVMEKERPAQQVAEIGYVVGDVKGKTAVLVDDMIDTAGTLCAAAQTVLDEGAARVIACATHGVFSGPAYERLAYESSQIERIVVTDTIPLRPGAPDNITVLSTAGTFADSIRRIFTDDSVSEIFAGENQLF